MCLGVFGGPYPLLPPKNNSLFFGGFSPPKIWGKCITNYIAVVDDMSFKDGCKGSRKNEIEGSLSLC